MVSDALVYRPVQARRHQQKPPVKYTYFYTERHMNAELALFFFLFQKIQHTDLCVDPSNRGDGEADNVLICQGC